MRLLLREVALRLSGVPGLFQGLHPAIQGVGEPLQSLDTPVRRLIRAGEQPADPRRHGRERRAYQLGGEGREVKVMHEASMRSQQCDDTHASGAYIIGQTRFPAPAGGTFTTTVLFGHTSTVAPSDVPSALSSG